MCGSLLGQGLKKLLALTLFALAAGAAQAQLHGAIFTTLPNGATVNANLYNDIRNVYLNGGPQNVNGAALQDGIYFFQVTNPNGHDLLSTTKATDRFIVVNNGRFEGRSDFSGAPGNHMPGGVTITPHPEASAPSPNGGLGVQLYPFNPTTNTGGEYKAWLILYREDSDPGPGKNYTNTTTYSSVATDGLHIDFAHRWSKTDNFKVKPPKTHGVGALSGTKFFDVNMNGVMDSNELPIGGFVIKVVLGGASSGTVYLTTDSTGFWSTQQYPSGTTYTVTEILPPDSHYSSSASNKWIQTAPGTINDPPGGYSGTITDHDVNGVNFGNTEQVNVSGVKFYDTNLNGKLDSGESTIANWPIDAVVTYPDGTPPQTLHLHTGVNGAYGVMLPIGSSYSIAEIQGGANWKQTGPPGNLYAGSIILGSGPFTVAYNQAEVPDLNFGNILKASISGYKFYDKNMNGKKDSGEPGVQGFTITINGQLPDGSPPFTDTRTTDATGFYSFGPYPDGTTYSLTETLPAGWKQTTTSPLTGTLTATGPYTTSTTLGDVTDQDFGNILTAPLSGHKFYDKNLNGQHDTGEPYVPGFSITITVTLPDGTTPTPETKITNSSGAFSFGPYPDGTKYSLSETFPAGWKQTSQATVTGTLAYSGSYTVDSVLLPVTNLDFGNVLVASLKGQKFYDKNMNGVLDAGESPVQGFVITITGTKPDGSSINDTRTTGADGLFSFGPYPDGTTYSLTETLVGTWLRTSSSPLTGTLTSTGPITVSSSLADVLNLNFGNIQQGRLQGSKFYDTNHDGTRETGEPGIQGFKIVVNYTKPNGSTGVCTLYTDSGGNWQSKLLPDGTSYVVHEVFPSSPTWVQTVPSSGGTYPGTINGGTGSYSSTFTIPPVTGLVFGNYAVVPISAHTKGYWHNQNGYATMNDGGTIVPELQMLNALCLVRLDGSPADFNTSNPLAGFQDFSTWITSDSNGSNMACQLSAQLAAMELNVEAGFVTGDQLIFAPGANSSNSLGIAKLSDLMAEANASVCANPNTSASGAARDHQTALEQALDNGNNNLNWVGTPIIIVSSY